jgi:exodeoxyribonuclease-3
MHACLTARVASPRGELTAIVAHLNPFDPDSRLIEARHLAREAVADQPVLLVGDFNGLSPRDAVEESYYRLPLRVQARHILVNAPAIAESPPLDTRAVALLEWAGFTDVFRKLHPSGPGFTMPTKVNHYPEGARMRIDYVFATPPLAARAKSCEVHQTVETDLGSDHYPLLAEFER